MCFSNVMRTNVMNCMYYDYNYSHKHGVKLYRFTCTTIYQWTPKGNECIINNFRKNKTILIGQISTNNNVMELRCVVSFNMILYI